jgi:enoyl-CoA hydratase
MPITRTASDAVAVLALELGRGNAIDHAFIDALNGALDDVEGDARVRAVVITGQGRTFCSGLDLLQSYAFDRGAMERYIDAFDALFVRVAAFPRPIVAAVNGHAIAGGCILAMGADYRIMAPGPYFLGANEVLLGIPFPAGAFEIARSAVPPALRAEALLEGRRYSPDEAVAGGIVHRLAGERGVVADAVDKARLFCAGAIDAVRATKAELVAPLLTRVDATRTARRARFLDAWFAPEARERIGRLRGELLRKSGGKNEP